MVLILVLKHPAIFYSPYLFVVCMIQTNSPITISTFVFYSFFCKNIVATRASSLMYYFLSIATQNLTKHWMFRFPFESTNVHEIYKYKRNDPKLRKIVIKFWIWKKKISMLWICTYIFIKWSEHFQRFR